MLTYLKLKLISPTTTSKLPPYLTLRISSLSQTSTLMSMKPEPGSKPKRPTCSNCAKPISLCLCTKLKTPNLDNNVHITILQHSLEKKHPLNTARIVKLGLKNVDVFTVYDVVLEAQFEIRPLEVGYALGFTEEERTQGVCGNASESFQSENEGLKVKSSRKRVFDVFVEVGVLGGSAVSDDFEGSGGALSKEEDCLLEQCDTVKVLEAGEGVKKLSDEPLLSVTIGKHGTVRNVAHSWKVQDEGQRLNFDQLIASPGAVESLAGGFVATKMQSKHNNGTSELKQSEEFEITVPPGSALLFPTENAVTMEAIDFEVRNLIVLDGTWSKAKKMYNENPWLKMLPSVRLDMEKLSLFSEVRTQPKPGCLSTVESIVYALKALGEPEYLKELDNLLEVLKSMVEDQRRCKDERLKKISST